MSFFVKRLSSASRCPERKSSGAAGYDLFSAQEVVINKREHRLVKTDIQVAIPEGYYGRIAPRSGLALKYGIDVGAGVVDSDYRGAVGVILFNHSKVPFQVKIGDRIAQLIIEKIITPNIIEVENIDDTARGECGFGSTGI